MKEIKTYSLLTLLFAIVAISNAQSQVQVLGTESMLDRLRLENSIKGIKETHYSEIDGNPFIFKEFTEGKVIMKNGDIFKTSLRFDIYAGEMHFKDNQKEYILVNMHQLQSIEFADLSFVYSDFIQLNKNGDSTSAYFELICEGGFKLLAKKNIRIKDAELPKLYQEAEPAKFVIRDDSFFIKYEELEAVRIKSKKDLKLYFEEKAPSILGYIKKHKLGTSRKDLLNIIEYANNNIQ